MLNVIEAIEKQQINTDLPKFRAGDTLRVSFRIKEGEKVRTQAFEGVCIAINRSVGKTTFTVRKVSFSQGVERIFPLYSPRVESIQVLRAGHVRRAKLYYLRDLRGKKARIKERQDFKNAVKIKSAA